MDKAGSGAVDCAPVIGISALVAGPGMEGVVV